MEKIKLSLVIISFMLSHIVAVSAQDKEMDPAQYVKEHVAFANLKILGVNERQFAQCLESKNYLNVDNKVRIVELKGVVYADNGKGNDRIANDGILTSTELFLYKPGAMIAAPGQYISVRENVTIVDEAFQHDEELTAGILTGKWGVKLKCTLVWEPCSSWPAQYQSFCLSMSWPMKGGVRTHCDLEFYWEL